MHFGTNLVRGSFCTLLGIVTWLGRFYTGFFKGSSVTVQGLKLRESN